MPKKPPFIGNLAQAAEMPAQLGLLKKSSIFTARKILADEARAIEAISELIDQQFDHAVESILGMSKEGRVIVSGMGKAGFIAMKISATLASTGVPSFFLHPAEALHGDLGRYTAKDIALILSNSGTTAEILKILGAIKQVGCPIITITGNPESELARHSDIVLKIGALEETGPLGLAPTTSTTAMLALGDALAMAILEQQNFSKEQFAFYHPGGNLGRSLMLVSELMHSAEDMAIVPTTMKTRDVLHRMISVNKRLGAASVVDNAGKLIGIVTDGDLRRQLDKGIEFLELPVESIMTRNPKTVEISKLCGEALRIMKKHKIDELVVVDSTDKPVGMVDIQDLVEIR